MYSLIFTIQVSFVMKFGGAKASRQHLHLRAHTFLGYLTCTSHTVYIESSPNVPCRNPKQNGGHP